MFVNVIRTYRATVMTNKRKQLRAYAGLPLNMMCLDIFEENITKEGNAI